MKSIKKIWGKILYYLASFLSFIFEALVRGIDLIMQVIQKIGKILLSIFSMGGLLFFWIFGPSLLFNTQLMPVLFFSILFLMTGRSIAFIIQYVNYMLTEYLFDRADFFIHGRKVQFETLSEYGEKFKNIQAERARKERERQQRAQYEQWENMFKQWSSQQHSQGNTGYGNNHWGGGNAGFGNQTYGNSAAMFQSEYEKSCDVLGVSYSADRQTIKSAYRQKAKKYHPDINKAADATEKFQEVQDAYEFLSDDNINRYQQVA